MFQGLNAAGLVLDGSDVPDLDGVVDGGRDKEPRLPGTVLQVGHLLRVKFLLPDLLPVRRQERDIATIVS